MWHLSGGFSEWWGGSTDTATDLIKPFLHKVGKVFPSWDHSAGKYRCFPGQFPSQHKCRPHLTPPRFPVQNQGMRMSRNAQALKNTLCFCTKYAVKDLKIDPQRSKASSMHILQKCTCLLISGTKDLFVQIFQKSLAIISSKSRSSGRFRNSYC